MASCAAAVMDRQAGAAPGIRRLSTESADALGLVAGWIV
jgi:hypothetical protein